MNLLQTLQTCCFRVEIESQITNSIPPDQPNNLFYPSCCCRCFSCPDNKVTPSSVDKIPPGDLPFLPSSSDSLHTAAEKEGGSVEHEPNSKLANIHRTQSSRPHKDELLTATTSTTNSSVEQFDEAQHKIDTSEQNCGKHYDFHWQEDSEPQVVHEESTGLRLDKGQGLNCDNPVSWDDGKYDVTNKEPEKKISQCADLKNSVSVIYFNQTNKPNELDATGSESETSLSDDDDDFTEMELGRPKSLIIREINEDGEALNETETVTANDKDNASNFPINVTDTSAPQDTQVTGVITPVIHGVTTVFNNLVGCFFTGDKVLEPTNVNINANVDENRTVKDLEQKNITIPEKVDSLPMNIITETADNAPHLLRGSEKVESNIISVEKLKSGHKSITFNLEPRICHYQSEDNEDIEIAKADVDKPNNNASIISATEIKTLPSEVQIKSISPKSSSCCINVNQVVSSCTLLRNKSKIQTVNKKLETCESETTERHPLSSLMLENTPPQNQEQRSSTDYEGGEGSMGSSFGNDTELEYSSSTETVVDALEANGMTLLNQSPVEIETKVEFGGPPLENISKNSLEKVSICLNQHRWDRDQPNVLFGEAREPHRKSINTKTTKAPQGEGFNLHDGVSVWEGAQINNSDDDENDLELDPIPQSQHRQQQLHSRAEAFVRNFAQFESGSIANNNNLMNPRARSSDAQPILVQQALNINPALIKPKPTKKKKKQGQHEKKVNQLLHSLVRLHDLHSSKEFEVAYTVALSHALMDANTDRPRTSPAAPTSTPYENDPPNLFTPWPKPSSTVRPRTAIESPLQTPSEASMQESELSSSEWERYQYDNYMSTQLPPFYMNSRNQFVPHSTAPKRRKSSYEKKQKGRSLGSQQAAAERLAKPKWVTAAYASSEINLSRSNSAASNYSTKSFTKSQPKLHHRPECKSAIMGTQTPSVQQRLLTPTKFRRHVNSTVEQTQKKIIQSAKSGLLPLVQRPKIEVETQTFKKVSKQEKTKKGKMFVPKSKEISVSSDEGQRSTSAQVRPESRRIKNAVEKYVASSDRNEKLKPHASESWEDKYFSTSVSQSQLKLKKVKVTTSQEADHIDLSYRIKPTSSARNTRYEVSTPTEHGLPNTQEKCDQDQKSYIEFSNIALIIPKTPSVGKDYIDLNIVVRRKAGDGTFPHLVDVVSEISPDNFYLIIDESEEFVSGESQLLDEGSAEQHEVDKSLTPERPYDFLISLSSPLLEQTEKRFQVRNFGKIPIENLQNLVKNNSIPTFQPETMTEKENVTFLRNEVNYRQRGRSRSLSRSKVLKQIRSLKSVDMDTLGLTCLATEDLKQSPSQEIINANYDDDEEGETDDKVDQLMAQLL
ncbi:uncharacterized protein LOC110843611 isoform X3 [Folsomia candida]|nr:uncharacterized protein LOC110843611 isoform X3 [Folsomia candida]